MRQPNWTSDGDSEYPVSVLVIADSRCQALKIKPWLEQSNCRTSWIESGFNRLASIRHHCFDLIVLDLEGPVDSRKVGQNLSREAELACLPLVVLISGTQDTGQGLEIEANFCVAKEVSLKSKLLQIVAEIRYLRLRYR